MATIRIVVMIGAMVLACLMAAAPARAQSDPAGAAATPSAPLKLTPTGQQHRGHHARRSKIRKHHRVTRRHTSTSKQTAEQSQNKDEDKGQTEGTIITAPAGVSLTSLLPWWHADGDQARSDANRSSQVLSVADAWFAARGIEETAPVENDYALASADEINEMDVAASGIAIADASELNEIDRALTDSAPQDKSADKSWLGILLASLGGVLAVASTVRYLFV